MKCLYITLLIFDKISVLALMRNIEELQDMTSDYRESLLLHMCFCISGLHVLINLPVWKCSPIL